MDRLVSDFLTQRPASARTYGMVLAEAERVLHKPLAESTHEDIVDYRATLTEHKPATIKKKMAALGSFFTYLRDRRIREDNPMWGIARVKVDARATAKFLDAEEQVRLIEGVKNVRSRAVIWVLLHGLRRAECESLNVSNLDGTVLTFSGKGSKVRHVPLESSAVEAIRAYLGERTAGPLFLNYKGDRLGWQTIQDTVYDETARTLGKRLSPHSLRHSFGTRLEEQGVGLSKIKELMGHSSTAITDIYVHLSPRTLVQTIETHPLIETEPRLRLLEGGLQEASA